MAVMINLVASMTVAIMGFGSKQMEDLDPKLTQKWHGLWESNIIYSYVMHFELANTTNGYFWLVCSYRLQCLWHIHNTDVHWRSYTRPMSTTISSTLFDRSHDSLGPNAQIFTSVRQSQTLGRLTVNLITFRSFTATPSGGVRHSCV